MLDVLVVMTAVVVGLIGGWWLRGSESNGTRPNSRDSDGEKDPREVVQRLRELTRDVAADFDQHKDLMRQMKNELHALECPVLVVHGTADRVIPLNAGQATHRLLPQGARWVEIEGAGHLIPARATEAFNAELLTFLLR